MKMSLEKMIYMIVESLTFLALVAFIIFNMDKTVSYTCPVMQKVYTTQLNYLVFGIYVISYAGGYACCGFVKTKVSDMCSVYQKRHENISITNESDKARIQTLEAKIQTLESALKSALENN